MLYLDVIKAVDIMLRSVFILFLCYISFRFPFTTLVLLIGHCEEQLTGECTDLLSNSLKGFPGIPMHVDNLCCVSMLLVHCAFGWIFTNLMTILGILYDVHRSSDNFTIMLIFDKSYE